MSQPIAHKILDAIARAGKRGRRVIHISMHPNAYRAWWATEVPGGDQDSLEWCGILFVKDQHLRGGKLRVRTERVAKGKEPWPLKIFVALAEERKGNQSKYTYK